MGVGKVVPGWDRALREMRVGEIRRVPAHFPLLSFRAVATLAFRDLLQRFFEFKLLVAWDKRFEMLTKNRCQTTSLCVRPRGCCVDHRLEFLVSLYSFDFALQNEVAIPPELGYGSAGFGSIPGHATLYLELELLRAAPFAPTAEQARWLREYPEGEASGG